MKRRDLMRLYLVRPLMFCSHISLTSGSGNVAKPHVKPHRYLHEAFRTTCLIQLHHDVLCEPPSSLHIRLLVRQSLSLLEAMIDQSLPGLCSAHWVIFLTALCCVAGGQDKAELDDRERVERIYDDILQV